MANESLIQYEQQVYSLGNSFTAPPTWFWVGIVIILLLLLIIGPQVNGAIGLGLEKMVEAVGGFILWILSLFGYATGTIINVTSDVATGTAQFGVNVADGTMHSVGNLLINSSSSLSTVGATSLANSVKWTPSLVLNPVSNLSTETNPNLPCWLNGGCNNKNNNIDQAIQLPSYAPSTSFGNAVAPSTTSDPIQKSLTSNKSQWCLVGEYMGRRGCVEISQGDKCLSGQIFNNETSCKNSTPK